MGSGTWEMEVVELIAAGMSDRGIGQILTISEGNAETHVSSLLGKQCGKDLIWAMTAALRRSISYLD
jgi:DNA-binding NarL/FixJ family response regulator